MLRNILNRPGMPWIIDSERVLSERVLSVRGRNACGREKMEDPLKILCSREEQGRPDLSEAYERRRCNIKLAAD